MQLNRLFLSLLVLALCVGLSVSTLFGQSANTSALTGVVTDPTGASIPGAMVTLTNTATNQSRTVETAADGVYRAPLVEPGTYRVRFGANGFRTADVTGVVLSVTETTTLNRALEVGQQTEQVTVEANVETVQTATSSLGTTVTGQTITALPLSSRNFTQVLGMSTGVAVEVNNGSAFGRGSQNMSVNGASPEKNNFQMDGVAINNAAGNGNAGDAGLYTGIAIPNPDALQEFKIQTSTYDASFGRNPGANVNVVTKSGTNALHGSLFEYFRNEALNANDFFYNRDSVASQTQKQILKQNQFGGTVGGKIITDKLFYFGSYQGTRQRNGVAPQGSSTVTLYPLPGGNRGTTSLAGVDDGAAAAFRSGLQANMCAPGVPAAGRGSLCGANALPINDVAMRLLQVKLPDGSYYIPGSGTAGTVQEFYSKPAKYTENQYLANVDYLMSQNHTLQMKYMFSENPHQYELSGQLPGVVRQDLRGNTSAVLRLTSILSPSVVNQARISFQRIIQNGQDAFLYSPQQIGLKPLIDASCCNGTTGGTYTLQTPMNIIGAFNIGGGLNPSFAPTNQTQYSEQLSWTKGSHTMRAGFEYENIRYPLVFGGLGRGWLFVNSFPDLLIGRAGCAPADNTCTPSNPGNTTGVTNSSFANCLFCVRSGVNGIIHNYHLRNMNAFFQDDWKVNSRLTLNLGVRWEYNGTLSDKNGNLTNFWLSDIAKTTAANIPSAQDFTNPAGFAGYVVPSNYDGRPISDGGHGPLPPGVRQFDGEFASTNRIPLSNFAPRIGFAWTPLGSNRLVVRGGVGIFYDRIGINRLVHAVQEGRPYADTTGLQHDIASLQSPYQDRPLALLPRWFDFTTLQGSSFNSPFYDRVQTPLIRQYNLGIQYEFIPSYVLEVAFVGSSGINIADYNHNVNRAAIASASNPVNGLITTTTGNANARVPYLGFLANGLQQNGFDGVYNYNSLQTTVRKNFSRGLGFQASYTWSKNLSTVPYDAANINDPTNLWNQYGQTPYSRPHRFVVSYQYQLPFRADGKALNAIVGGWSVSGLTTIQSGSPLSIIDNRAGSIYGTPYTGTIENGVSTASLAPGMTYEDIQTSGDVKSRLGGKSGGSGYFDKTVFTAPGALLGGTTYGTAGLGIVRGPHQLNFDFTATKMFRLTERQSLQFRADFFNLFNHAQFALPLAGTSYTGGVGRGELNVNNALFGQIFSTSVNPRLVQFALRYSF